MFDDVPTRIWLLLAIALIAFAPARYLYHHFMQAPSRRDITQPSVDLSWRTSRQFTLCLAMLLALISLAVFIFTPAAEQFAASPSFWPILFCGFAAWAFYAFARGAITGTVEPIVKGNFGPYERATKPWQYWASMTWNASLAIIILLLVISGEV